MTFSPNPFVTGATCVVCGKHFSPADIAYTCPDHGQEGILDYTYDYAAAKKYFPMLDQPGMWRYRALLPLPLNTPVPPLLVGQTPLYQSQGLAKFLGQDEVWIKDDSRQPTASFKDRASALAVALAGVHQSPIVATASTGNAAAALAGLSAATGQACVIFVPASAPPAKLAQLRAYGAHIFLVQGSYDQAFDLCMEACRIKGWYNRNTGYNPAMAEGKKTAAFEVGEQMSWQLPDALFVGVGDGCIIAGLHKGFADLQRLGLISHLPRIYGVQAAGSDFMFQAQQEERFTPEALLAKAPIAANTIADSISAGLPRDRIKAMNATRQSGGAFVRVEDEAILEALALLAQKSGIFSEPAAASALAGLIQAQKQGLIQPTEKVCLMITGSGLKDIQSVQKAVTQSSPPFILEPSVQALKDLLQKVSF